MWVFVATRVIPASLDILVLPDPPSRTVLVGKLRGGIINTGASGPSHRLDDVSFEIDVPRSTKRLVGKRVTAVGDFELKSFSVERHDVQIFVANHVKEVAMPAPPPAPPADIEAEFNAETDYVAAGTHHGGFIDGTSEEVVGGSGRLYHREFSFVAPRENSTTFLNVAKG